MATIYFTRGSSDIQDFYRTNVGNPQEEIERLNNDDDNFIDDEQICFFGYIPENYLEHEFYGFNSREEMMEAVL